MKSDKLHGLIIKRSNFSEADKLVTVFSLEKGKITLLAKGIRRIKSRRSPHLELFNQAEIQTSSGKNFDLVSEAKVINSFSSIKSSLELSGFSFYLSEIIDRILPEKVPHPEVYSDLLVCLKKISRLSKDRKMTENTVKEFVLRLLWELGYLPSGKTPKKSLTEFVESIVEHQISSKKFLDEV